MRVHPILPLVVALAIASCDNTVGPRGNGTLIITTSTEGEDPDEDGYLLVVDDTAEVPLGPSGTTEVDVTEGRHRLRLLGVAGQCAVTPGVSLTVQVPLESSSTVDFGIDCPATGVRVTTTVAGLDPDANGYRIAADGVDRGAVPATGTTLILVGPGSRTIALTGIADNCAAVGPGSHIVTVVDGEVAPVHFDTECTARTAVIGVAVAAEGVDINGAYSVTLEGVPHVVQAGRTTYVRDVAAGTHLVSLDAPANCTVETDQQSVTVTAGGMVRDTAEVTFAVSCTTRFSGVEISVQTSGTPPPHDYTAWACTMGDFYCQFYGYLLGSVNPNGTLLAELAPGTYDVWLADIPTTCTYAGPRHVALGPRQIIPISYVVTCP